MYIFALCFIYLPIALIVLLSFLIFNWYSCLCHFSPSWLYVAANNIAQDITYKIRRIKGPRDPIYHINRVVYTHVII